MGFSGGRDEASARKPKQIEWIEKTGVHPPIKARLTGRWGVASCHIPVGDMAVF